MNNIIGFPAHIGRIPSEIDKHGKSIAKEIEIASMVIDDQGSNINKEMKFHGDNITREMQLMRESFEREMTTLNKKTRNTVCIVLAVNVLSRVIFR